MLQRATQIIGLPVRVRGNAETQGKVERIIFDPKNGRLHGLLLKKEHLFQQKYFVLYDAVITIEEGWIEIGTAAQIMKLKDDALTLKIAAQEIALLGQRIITEGNREIGAVAEFHFDLESGQLMDIVVRPTIFTTPKNIREERQLTADQILSYFKQAIIVKDPEAREQLKILKTTRKKMFLETPEVQRHNMQKR